MFVTTKDDVIFAHVYFMDSMKYFAERTKIVARYYNFNIIEDLMLLVDWAKRVEAKVVIPAKKAYILGKERTVEFNIRNPFTPWATIYKDRLTKILENGCNLGPLPMLYGNYVSSLEKDCEKVLTYLDRVKSTKFQTYFVDEDKFCKNAVHLVARLLSIIDGRLNDLENI